MPRSSAAPNAAGTNAGCGSRPERQDSPDPASPPQSFPCGRPNQRMRSYEGPSVKRRARCVLQHGCLFCGFLFQAASLGSGSASGVIGSERVGTGRTVWRAPNSYPGGRRRHCRSVPRSRLLRAPRSGRRDPSILRRLSAQRIIGHAPPDPAPAASGRSGNSKSRAQATRAPVGTRPVLA